MTCVDWEGRRCIIDGGRQGKMRNAHTVLDQILDRAIFLLLRFSPELSDDGRACLCACSQQSTRPEANPWCGLSDDRPSAVPSEGPLKGFFICLETDNRMYRYQRCDVALFPCLLETIRKTLLRISFVTAYRISFFITHKTWLYWETILCPSRTSPSSPFFIGRWKMADIESNATLVCVNNLKILCETD